MILRPDSTVPPWILGILLFILGAAVSAFFIIRRHNALPPVPVSAFDQPLFGVPPKEYSGEDNITLDEECEGAMRAIYREFEGIDTLQFTIRGVSTIGVLEEEPQETDARYTVAIEFDEDVSYSTTEENLGTPREFPGRVRVDYTRADQSYRLVIKDGLVRYQLGSDSMVLTRSQGEYFPQLAGIDALLSNHYGARYDDKSLRCSCVSRQARLEIDESDRSLESVHARGNNYKTSVEYTFTNSKELEAGIHLPRMVETRLFPGIDPKSYREMVFEIEDIAVNEPLAPTIFELTEQ